MASVLQKDVKLSAYSTFRIGGEAKFFLSCKTVDELKKGVLLGKSLGLPTLIIGHGSNCLFPDEGFCGLVLHNALSLSSYNEEGSFVVEAGYSFSRLGIETANKGWAGLEFAAGIPGTVGGAVFMNAGAGGQETSSVLEFVDVLEDQEIHRIQKGALHFGYRFSSFQEKNCVIVRAGFVLKKDLLAPGRQKELLEYRRKTQPYNEPSAGCVFRNPPGHSAGKLIEDAGLKGTRIGGAEISSVHANFIVNKGNASSSDVKALIHLVQETILEKNNMSLICEVRMI